MAKIIDETGNKYGILTVIGPAGVDKNHKALWKCQCECGKIITVVGSNLRKGNTTSCGCRRLSNDVAEIGKKYGMLTVIECAGRTSYNKVLWKCRCECGNETIVQTGHLHSGSVVSCGCKNKAVKKDETGKTYGLLTVIGPGESSPNNTDAYWKCQCKCGNIVNISGVKLRTGNTQSCGCVKSIGEYNIIQLLTKNNIPFKSQYGFEDLKYINPLKFDFAIFDQNGNLSHLIEFDGPQHIKGNPWHNETVALRDQIKNEYCKEKGIPLIRIPYKKRDSLTLQDLLEMREM